MPEQQTRLLAERYELIAPLGRGTMGTVWRARDRALGREVAVKEIRQDPGLTEEQRGELRERMVREGRIAARINHPSVASIHDVLVYKDSPWIIMELVEARSLEQVIDEEGPLPPRLVAEIGVDLLGALRAAHTQGITHRDVKPGNVLITETGRVVLTDFGIAKAEGDSRLTKTGMVIGSPGYTAPERARGEYTGPESDVWSLGATLYFAVEGRPAYERATISETLAALLSENADPPTQAGQLRPVLTGLLNKDYRKRLSAAKAETMLRMIADTPTNDMPAITGDEPPAVPAPKPAQAPRPQQGSGPQQARTGGPAPAPGSQAAGLSQGSPARPDVFAPRANAQGAPPVPPSAAPNGPGAHFGPGPDAERAAPQGFAQGPPARPGTPAPGANAVPGSPGPAVPAASPQAYDPERTISVARPKKPLPQGRESRMPQSGPPGQQVYPIPAGQTPPPPPPMQQPPMPMPQPPQEVREQKGLGTDLFAIANGPEQRPAGNRTGMLILMAVAAFAAVVIAILIVAALSS